MEKFNKRIEEIRTMMSGMKVEMYAIVNPELAALDEYTKNLYLKVLCTVVQYENEPSEMQTLYLKRLIAGIGTEEPLEEYMRKALEISDVDIKEFISYMKEDQVRYYFALESMVLTAMGQQIQDNYEYLAELIELCGITKEDLKYLAFVAESILRQDSGYYDTAKDSINDRTRSLNFYPYISNYYAGALIDNDNEQYYTAPGLGMNTNDIILPAEYTARKVTFRNLVINLGEDCKFEGCETVDFINCKITTDNSKALYFKAIGNVSFIECEFYDMDNHVACFESVNNVEVKQCTLRNCGWIRSMSDYKGALFKYNWPLGSTFNFINNKVLNCYIKNTSSYAGCTGILIDSDEVREGIIRDNEFIGCQCINNNTGKAAAIIGGAKRQFNYLGNKMTGAVTRLFENE